RPAPDGSARPWRATQRAAWEALRRSRLRVLEAYFDESERSGGIFCVAGFVFTPAAALAARQTAPGVFPGRPIAQPATPRSGTPPRLLARRTACWRSATPCTR